MPHLNGDEEHLVEREEHGNLDQHRQAASLRSDDLLALVKLHHLLLEGELVILEAFLQRLQLRLHGLHLRHRGIGLVGEREEDRLDHKRDQQDGDAEIADEVEEPVHQPEHGFVRK